MKTRFFYRSAILAIPVFSAMFVWKLSTGTTSKFWGLIDTFGRFGRNTSY